MLFLTFDFLLYCWLLEMSEGNIDYPQLKELAQDGVNKNKNLLIWAEYNNSSNSIIL